MKNFNSDKLNTYLSERNKNYEMFIQRLAELHLRYDHSFAEYGKKKKNLKWLILFFSSLLVAYLIMSWLSQLEREPFITILALFSGLILILFIRFRKNKKYYLTDKLEYDREYNVISIFLEEVEKYESLLKEEILINLVFNKYQKEILLLKEEEIEAFFLSKKEEQLIIIQKEILGEINDREILNYFLNWQAKIDNKDARDYRKEKIEYLNRLEKESEKTDANN